MHKLAFVTGASSGIGKDLAILLAQRGYELVLFGRNIEQLQALQKFLKPRTLVAVYTLDLRREFDVEKLVSLIHALIPSLVINCAGIGFYGEITDGPLKEQLDIIHVNVTAAAAATIAACNALKVHKKEGIICNVSSAIAFMAAPRMSVYAASKAFINSFSLAADAEMKPHGGGHEMVLKIIVLPGGDLAGDVGQNPDGGAVGGGHDDEPEIAGDVGGEQGDIGIEGAVGAQPDIGAALETVRPVDGMPGDDAEVRGDGGHVVGAREQVAAGDLGLGAGQDIGDAGEPAIGGEPGVLGEEVVLESGAGEVVTAVGAGGELGGHVFGQGEAPVIRGRRRGRTMAGGQAGGQQGTERKDHKAEVQPVQHVGPRMSGGFRGHNEIVGGRRGVSGRG